MKARIAQTSVDEYLALQPKAVQGILEQVRDAIRAAVPRAEELISYQIPAYKLDGEVVLYFAGWKEHYSLYPVSPELLEAFKDELGDCKISKATIQFPLSRAVPVRLIGRIAKFRAKEAVERGKRKAARVKKRTG